MNVVIIGTGKRCQSVYVPTIREIPGLTLIGVCGHHVERTTMVASTLGVRLYQSVEQVLTDPQVHLVIICVTWTENAEIYNQLALSDKPALIETPLAHNFDAAMDVAKLLASRNSPTEVAEQYHLRPIEVLKRSLISKGIFGDIFYAFNDGVGHEYHGISLIRSYIGFDQRVARIAAMQNDMQCFPHRMHKNIFFNGERVQHALIQFESGKQATYHWSWLAYESPIRARRLSGFHGTMGAAWGDECVIFRDKDAPSEQVYIERRTRVVNGLEVPFEYHAFLSKVLVSTWRNPFPEALLSEELTVTATFLERIMQRIHHDKPPLYSVAMALEDMRIVQAMSQASEMEDKWVTLTNDERGQLL